MSQRFLPLLALPLFTVLAACDGASDHRLRARFVDGTAGQQQQALNGVEGLYFGELEIVAYDHRPGESVQTGTTSSGFTGSDWSHWVALANGYDEARDNVLSQNGALDFADFGDVSPPLEQAFVESVGTFEIDFLEVYMYRTGVIANGAYYGHNAELNGLDQHPLHKYPQWSSIDDTYTQPQFPGFDGVDGQDVNVLFARNDWFPEALTVVLEQEESNGYSVKSSSRTLTADQKSKLESLAAQGTTRRFYHRLVIVPFSGIDGPVVVALNGQTPADGSAVTPDELNITVNFDLTNLLAPATDLDAEPPVVAYSGDANDVPFGLSVSFAE